MGDIKEFIGGGGENWGIVFNLFSGGGGLVGLKWGCWGGGELVCIGFG